MNGYAIQTPDQLKHVIVGFRKSAGLSQQDLAVRLGVTQQTYSTSPAEDILQGDLDTAKAYGERVAAVAAKLRG